MIPEVPQGIWRVIAHGAPQPEGIVVRVEDEVVALDAGVKVLVGAFLVRSGVVGLERKRGYCFFARKGCYSYALRILS